MIVGIFKYKYELRINNADLPQKVANDIVCACTHGETRLAIHCQRV